jgi:CTP synthase
MPDQRGLRDKGGTMRLGAFPCALKPGSRAAEVYGREEISERHRHRFEFNNDFREPLTRAGLALSGTSPDDRLVEIIELNQHPYFIGCQFHPEFKSRPNAAHPLFSHFVRAACARRDELARSVRDDAPSGHPTETTVN